MSELKRLMRKLERASSAKEKHLALEDLAEYHYRRTEYHDALMYYQDELDAAVELGNDEKIAKAHRMIGEVKVELMEFDEAISHTKKYLDYACADDKRLVEQQRALTTLGRAYLVQGLGMADKDCPQFTKSLGRAKLSFWKSLELCDKIEQAQIAIPKLELNDMRARSILNLGLVYEGLGQFDKAITQYNLSLKLCRKFKIDSTLRTCCQSYGCLLIRQKNFSEAFKLYKEALASVKSLPDKDRSKEAVEILFAEAEGHMWKGDVHSARKTLHKAYKLSDKSCPPAHVVERLKLVAAMDLAQKRLLKNADLSAEEKSKIYEEIGDGFANIGVFSIALTNYEKMLEHAKAADSNLKACYVSLAQTSMDLKDFRNAILYLKQETEYCKTPKDTCDSLLRIQECQEKLKAPPTEQIEILEKAFKIAEKMDKPKYTRNILLELEKVQNAALQHEKAQESRQKLNDLGDLSSDSEDEEETGSDEQTPNIGEYIDIDALSDSGDDEEGFGALESTFGVPVVPRTKRNPNRSKAAVKWKNEKGETKLHVACINGNVNAVRTLLEQGSDVHATDNAGWTPLHEACNHGFLDIVEMLLEHGANINHRGGPETGGITPLYDAAQAGNFEIMEFLLDRKASVTVLTDDGATALDALLAYYERSHTDLNQEEKHQFLCLKDRLKEHLEKVGIQVTKKSHNDTEISRKECSKDSSRRPPTARCGNLRRLVDDEDETRSHRKRSMREISPVSDDNSILSSDDDQGNDNGDGQEGVSEYINAMQNLRKIETPISSEHVIRKPLEPLVGENEIVENWLEDDLGKKPNKKRRKSDQSTVNGVYKPLSLKKKSASRLSLNSCSSSRASSVSSIDTREDPRLSTGSKNSDIVENSVRFSDGDEDMLIDQSEDHQPFDDSWSNSINHNSSDVWAHDRPVNLNHVRQSSLLSFGVTRVASQMNISSQSNSTQIPQQPPSQVNVRVGDHLLAIFVHNPSLSIGWLAEEAAKRYKKLDGSLPVLSICSSDGALYSDEDPVSMVIGSDVVGNVKSWNESSIVERYEEACKILDLESDAKILPLLEASQATCSVDIVDTLFPTHVFKPVFRAISMERNLVKINLCNNNLKDKGVTDLCENLGKMVSLKELNLSSNNITAEGVSELAKAGSKHFLKVLLSLNLSHNNLGDGSLLPLVELTASVPQLQNLFLADCMFTKSMWDKCDKFLTLSNVQTLDLSANQLHVKGLAGFLGFSDHMKERRLNPEVLQSLYLIGLGGEQLCQEVLLFLEQGNSISLKELHLSYSKMKDDELLQLLGFLRSAPSLHTIRVPAAPTLKGETVCRLLVEIQQLKKFELHNGKSAWKNVNEASIVDAISHAALSALEVLTLRDLPEAAKVAWCSVKGPSAVVRRGALGLQTFSSVTS